MSISYSKLFVGISLPALCTGLASLLLSISANAQPIRPTTQKELKVFDPIAGSSGNIGIRAAAGTLSYTLTLPAARPTANQVLSASAVTGGNVSLTWATPVSGTVTSVGLSTGTTGTDVNVSGSPITSSGTITVNIPTASATNTGKLSSTDWSTFNNKQNAIALTITGTSGAATLVGATLNIPQYQAVLTNPVTGTGTTNYLSKFANAGTLTNSLLFDNGTNIVVGTATPSSTTRFEIRGTGTTSTTTALEVDNSNGSPLLVVRDDGSVGIGTTSPRSALEIQQGTSAFFRMVRSGSSADYGFEAGINGMGLYDYTDSDYRWFVSPTGNVGIGTTSVPNILTVGSSENSTNTLPALRVQGQSLSDGAGRFLGSYGSLILNANSTYSGSARRFMLTSALNFNSFAIIRSENNNSDPSLGVAGALASGSADFVIDHTGEVGIGTQAPTARLQVAGNNITTSNTLIVQDGSSNNLLTIRNDGYSLFGPNTTSTEVPVARFITQKFGRSNGIMLNAGGTLTTTSGDYIAIYLQEDNKSAIQAGDNSTGRDLLLNPGSGNVGIGTTSPGSQLTIVSPWTAANGSGGTPIFSISGNNNSNSSFVGGARISPTIGTLGTENLSLTAVDISPTFYANNSTTISNAYSLRVSATKSGSQFITNAYSLYVDAPTGATYNYAAYFGGNVGIGTTSPMFRLVVEGAQETGAPFNGNKFATLGLIATNTDVGAGGSIEFGVRSNTTFSAIKGLGVSATSYTTGDLAFYTRAQIVDASMTERMRITYTGNVGIGTTSPGSDKLQINEPTNADINVSIIARGGNSKRAQLNFAVNNSGGTNVGGSIGSSGARAGGLVLQGHTDPITANETHFFISAGGETRLRASSHTRDEGDYNLQVFGTGVYGAGAYFNGSDSTLKKNIKLFPSSTEVLKKLRPVTYNYKPSYSKDATLQAGFIAQEVQEALKNTDYVDGVVKKGSTLSMAYQSLIPLLTKALQESIDRIEVLEKKISILEQKASKN